MLPTLLSDPAKYLADMRQFAARFGDPGLPPRYAWLEKPVRQIASLFSQILAVGKMTASR
jgi:hypothetical protein